MVQPLAISPSAYVGGPVILETERPVSQPEPARQVTAAAETTNSDPAAGERAELIPTSADRQPSSSLDKTLEQINSHMQAWSTGMRFEVDDDAQRVVISIIDTATGDVLRTVPSDAVLRVAKMIVQLQGNTVDTKV